MGKKQKFTIGHEVLQSFPSPSAAVIDVPAPPPRASSQAQPTYPAQHQSSYQKQGYPPPQNQLQQQPQYQRFPPPPQQIQSTVQVPVQRYPLRLQQQQAAVLQQSSPRPKAPQQIDLSRPTKRQDSSSSSIYAPAGDISRRVDSDVSLHHSRSSESYSPRHSSDHLVRHTASEPAIQIPKRRGVARSPVRLNLIKELRRLWKDQIPTDSLQRPEMRSLIELVRTTPKRPLNVHDFEGVLFNPDMTPFDNSSTRMLFNSYCQSPSGHMTDEEFLDLCECLKQMERTYFKQDRDGDGAMSFFEFKTTMRGHRIKEDTLWNIFLVYAKEAQKLSFGSFIECCCAMTKALEISQVVEYGYDRGIALSKNNFFKEFIKLRQH